MKGLLCHVYRNGYRIGEIQTNEVILIGKDTPEIFKASKDCPAVVLVTENFYGSRKQLPRIEPVTKGEWAFGGNFVYSPDSRFPYDTAVKLFDYNMDLENNH